jgi:HemY protein
MIRVIFFLVLVAVAALAAAWLVERPGDVAVTWMGWRIETSVTVAAAAVTLAVIAALLMWSLVRLVLRSPRLLAHARRERRQRRGQRALSRGLVAAASGDLRAAKKFSAEAERFAGDEPLALLLRAQTAQIAGDRSGADAAFRAMVDEPETRLLGLRGLFVEAQRRGDAEAGRRFAEEAARGTPALAWAGQAVFDFRCAAGDWAGALAALDANLRGGLVDRAAFRRQRAVLLTARALDAEESEPQTAKSLAQEAAKLAPDLVPAVALAARQCVAGGEWRRAGKLIEAAWRTQPHPDLADIYAHLRPGGSARDRLARVETLVRLKPGEREGALALARAALDAREFAKARAALAPLLSPPTQRVALLMAELEEAEHGDAGRAREWMGRALRAGGDPRWTADGMVSDRWLPVSPVSGKIDAFVWKVPVEELGPAALDGPPLWPVEALPPAAPPPDPMPAPAASAAPAEAARSDAPKPAAKPDAARAEAAARADLPKAEASRPEPARPAAPRRDPVIPLIHAPDDPGPDAEPDPAPTNGSPRGYPAGLR